MRRPIAATTRLQESTRQSEQLVDRLPSAHESIRQIYGTIREVHPEMSLIKASTSSGSPIANGDWIPLNHSVSDIIERWGTLRKGMRVHVSYTGPDGIAANATIIGTEGDIEGEDTMLENDIDEPLWEIFTPGASAI